ncbi:MAG: hypothetical protein K6E29_08610 [Cyanobacteria bacterium RUI128]|nr:hypothetical protein [Cyanobacteria bacterium RUI128]
MPEPFSRKYDFEPTQKNPYEPGSFKNQKGHSDFNTYMREKYAQGGYDRLGLYLSNSGDAPLVEVNQDAIHIQSYNKGADGQYDVGEKIDIPTITVTSEGAYVEPNSPNNPSFRMNPVFGIADGRAYTENLAATYASNSEIIAAAFQNVPEFEGKDTITQEDVNAHIKTVLENNNTTPDFQEFMRTEGAEDASELASCLARFNDANTVRAEKAQYLQSICSGTEPSIAAAKEKITNTRAAFYEVLGAHKDELGELVGQIRSIDREADDAQQEVDDLNQQILDTENQYTELSTQHAALEGEIGGINNRINSLKATKENYEASNEEGKNDSKISALQTKIDEY